GRIDGEFPSRTHVDARQVADRVVVFGIAEAPGEYHPGVTVMLACFIRPGRLNPVDHVLPRLIGRLARLSGRHLSGGEPGQYAIPTWKIPDHRLRRGVLPQIQLCGRPGSAMAARAVRVEERLHGLREPAF